MGGGAGTSITRSLFEVGNLLINDCYDGAALGFGFDDNFVHGDVPSGPVGNCISKQTMGDPVLQDPAKGNYHPTSPMALEYGAYAP
ncbi:MAG: hypothetical protein QM820_08840 [Minicystis sp.]